MTLREMYESIILAHNTGRNQDFQKAVKKNLLILDRAGNKPPRDGALYNLGLIYANIEYPAKDFKKSQHYFNQLIEEFPEGILAREARIWLGLFQVIEKMQQIDIEIEQQKRKFTR
ncbi:MAG: tol-pal system YbgF family protein [Desulfurivibrionaceae bacterium]